MRRGKSSVQRQALGLWQKQYARSSDVKVIRADGSEEIVSKDEFRSARRMSKRQHKRP